MAELGTTGSCPWCLRTTNGVITVANIEVLCQQALLTNPKLPTQFTKQARDAARHKLCPRGCSDVVTVIETALEKAKHDEDGAALLKEAVEEDTLFDQGLAFVNGDSPDTLADIVTSALKCETKLW